MPPCARARDVIPHETKVELCADVDSTKADSDKKSYRLIKLENGLRALLVHDPTATATPAASSSGCVHAVQSMLACGAIRFTKRVFLFTTVPNNTKVGYHFQPRVPVPQSPCHVGRPESPKKKKAKQRSGFFSHHPHRVPAACVVFDVSAFPPMYRVDESYETFFRCISTGTYVHSSIFFFGRPQR